jgi:capsid protein
MAVPRFLAAILDAAEWSRGRRDLQYFGRETKAEEDRLLPQADRDKVSARCHDLRRNNPIISGACDRITDNVIGPRILMQARTSSEEWNNIAEGWLSNWAAAIDPARRTSLTMGARFAVGARLYDGEIYFQPAKSGQLGIVEAERVRPAKGAANELPYLRDETTGVITAWRVHGRDRSGGFTFQHDERWVQGMIHCARRWRPDQVRGWPDLAPVANIVTDLNEINNATLRKSKMGALAAWIYSKGVGGNTLMGRTASAVSGGQPLHRFQEGQIYEIEQGAKLEPFQNNQPGQEYSPFVELNLRLVGMALGLPYEFLLMYFGGGSFSSSKASLLQAYKTIETWQEWVESEYLMPVIAWRIDRAIRDRELPPAPVDARGVSEFAKWEWQRPGVEWIDPQNAIQTEMQEVRIGASDMYAVCARRGRDAEETARANARYLKMLDRIGAEEGIDPARLHAIQIPGQTPTVATPAAPPAPPAKEKTP